MGTLDVSERGATIRRVIETIESDTAIPCGDLADLAHDLPSLREWREWLERRRFSALRVQRTPTQRITLLAELGALLEDLETKI